MSFFAWNARHEFVHCSNCTLLHTGSQVKVTASTIWTLIRLSKQWLRLSLDSVACVLRLALVDSLM